jgi:hypothetical protein
MGDIMKTKMTLEELKALFPPTMPDVVDKDVESDAQKKGHKHQRNPARSPSTGNITPAKYRRRHLGRKP